MRRYLAIAVTVLGGVALLAGCAEEYPDLEDGLYAELETTRGTILIELAYDKAPLTVTNFVGLAEGTIDSSAADGEPFYDGLTFHRVVEDFVIQTGDPDGDGSGGPGYRFPNEIEPSLSHGSAGVVSMANSGPDTNGSQFFITKSPAPWLDGQYSIFGEVVEGQDVVDSIQEDDTLETVEIIRKGEAAADFETGQDAFDERLAEVRETRREDQRRTVAQQLSYVEDNWPEAEAAEGGMRYIIEEEGSGPSPEAGDTVAVHYTGYLLNGMPFESTREREEPVQFTLGEESIIEGWERTLLDMRVGETRRAIIPPNLAYGSRGARNVIPPNSFIVLDVELLDIIE
jgi:peptidylprolyl isomerase